MSSPDFSPQWWSSCPSPLIFQEDDFTLDGEAAAPSLPSYEAAPNEEGARQEGHEEEQDEIQDDGHGLEVQEEQPPPPQLCSVQDTCRENGQGAHARPAPTEGSGQPVRKKSRRQRTPEDQTSLLRETYKPTPSTTRDGADVEAFLRIAGAVLVPDPMGFVVTDATHTKGKSLWTFIFSLLGLSAMGQNVLSETSAWRVMHQYQQRLRQTDPELRKEVMGDLEWNKPKRARSYSFTLPRPSSSPPLPPTDTAEKTREKRTKTKTVRACFYMGVTLRNPFTDASVATDLQRVLQHLAPGVSPAVVKEALKQYKALWATHKPQPLACVRYRRIVMN